MSAVSPAILLWSKGELVAVTFLVVIIHIPNISNFGIHNVMTTLNTSPVWNHCYRFFGYWIDLFRMRRQVKFIHHFPLVIISINIVNLPGDIWIVAPLTFFLHMMDLHLLSKFEEQNCWSFSLILTGLLPSFWIPTTCMQGEISDWPTKSSASSTAWQSLVFRQMSWPWNLVKILSAFDLGTLRRSWTRSVARTSWASS